MKKLLLALLFAVSLYAQDTTAVDTMVIIGSEGPVVITIPHDSVKEETARQKAKIHAFEKGKQVVSVGTAFAFGSYYDGAFGGYMAYDYGLANTLSLGAGLTAYVRDNTDEALVIPNVRLGFHFLSTEPLRKKPISSWCDLYAVLELGSRIYREHGETSSELHWGLPIGVRFYFTSVFGLQIESDWEDMMLSAAFRF